MLFEARELKPYAESVSADELMGGSVSVYFQDAESYRSGIRFPSSETAFIAQRKDEAAYILNLSAPCTLIALPGLHTCAAGLKPMAAG